MRYRANLLSIKRGSSRGFLQRFYSSSSNRSIILPFSELMGGHLDDPLLMIKK